MTKTVIKSTMKLWDKVNASAKKAKLLLKTAETAQMEREEKERIESERKLAYCLACIETGEGLCEMKETLPHGEFGIGLKQMFTESEKTAQNYMRAYKKYGNEILPPSCISDAYKELGIKAESKAKLSKTVSDSLVGIKTYDDFAENGDSGTGKGDKKTDHLTEESDNEWEPINSPISVKATVIDNDKTPLDRFKQEIPETLQPVFGEVAQNFKRWKQTLESVKKEMIDNLDELGYEWLDQKYIKPRFDNIYELLRMAEPYCVCPVCQGDGGMGAKCKVCLGRGRVTKPIFNAIPDDYKIGLDI